MHAVKHTVYKTRRRETKSAMGMRRTRHIKVPRSKRISNPPTVVPATRPVTTPRKRPTFTGWPAGKPTLMPNKAPNTQLKSIPAPRERKSSERAVQSPLTTLSRAACTPIVRAASSPPSMTPLMYQVWRSLSASFAVEMRCGLSVCPLSVDEDALRLGFWHGESGRCD